MDFVCRNFDTTLNSVSQVISVSEKQIQSTLNHDWENQFDADRNCPNRSDLSTDTFTGNLGEYILLNGFPDAELPFERPTVHWFHGTRTAVPEDFLRYGVLPLPKMYPKIKQMVDNIADTLNIKIKNGISKVQDQGRFQAELKLRNPKNQDGPFAMLMYDALSDPQAFDDHNYIDEPEIIVDYAMMKYGEDADLILKEFKRIAFPVIVEFVEPENTDELPLRLLIDTAIQYLYGIIHKGKTRTDGNICFSGHGYDIPSSSIIKIYRL